ncbi:MAG: PDZ domain-containing protein [Deltaproteobacteria bacterium]|nr:PDZ domain-containing protein [Deltaproteobacteria bacterium]MBW1914117.1 PDZ domain-containing protein [Deltaproteobacteria bacterium]
MVKFYYIIFNLLVLSSIIYTSVNTFYMVVNDEVKQLIPSQTVKTSKAENIRQVSQPLRSYRAVTDRSLFGIPEKPKVEEVEEVPEEPEVPLELSALKLQLLGTIIDSQGSNYAVIKNLSKKKQHLYEEGEAIQNVNDVLVKKISRREVVITNKGTDEILTMNELTPQAPASRPVRRAAKSFSTSPVMKSGQARTIVLPQEDVDAALNDLNSLLSQARILPHFTNGKSDGLALSGVKSGSIFSQMGLRSGDILQGINGETIKTPEDVFSMYQGLKTGSDISVIIKRGGQPRTINYQFK